MKPDISLATYTGHFNLLTTVKSGHTFASVWNCPRLAIRPEISDLTLPFAQNLTPEALLCQPAAPTAPFGMVSRLVFAVPRGTCLYWQEKYLVAATRWQLW